MSRPPHPPYPGPPTRGSGSVPPGPPYSHMMEGQPRRGSGMEGMGYSLPRVPGMGSGPPGGMQMPPGMGMPPGPPIHPGVPPYMTGPGGSGPPSVYGHGGSMSGGSLVASPEEEEDEIEEMHPQSGGASTDDKKRRPHATRRRVVQSCSECRRRKIKCDKKFPCGPCILRNDQARCHEVGMAEKNLVQSPSSFATTQDLALVAQRLDALEAALVKSGSLLPTDLDNFLKSMRAHAAGFESDNEPPRKIVKTEPLTRTSQEDDSVDETEGAALTLEHLAFGRSRVDGSHSIPHFGAGGTSSISKHVSNNDYHLARSSLSRAVDESPASGGPSANSPARRSSLPVPAQRGSLADRKDSEGKPSFAELSPEDREVRMEALLDMIGPTDVFDLFYRKTEIFTRSLVRVLPSREKGELLVKTYLEKVDWLHRCLHVPTFLRQCNDLWALPPEMVPHEIALPFVALYITVCTLGLTFMDSAEASRHFSAEDIQALPDLWFKTARSTMWAADFLGTLTTETLQCVILLSIFMDRGEAAWALLGAAIKIAQALGLPRLGAEQQAVGGKPLPMWTGRWESLIQREVGRRIWWNLVFLDWAFAPSYNFSCSVSPDQIKTALPANVDDEDLIDGQPLAAKPMTVKTQMSFMLIRIRFAEFTYRQIWQANNNTHPPYSFTLGVDAELRKAMMDVPAYFQPDSSDRAPPSKGGDPKALVHYYEKIMMNLAIHSRMLRLHRPWLSKGYEDERFAYSKEQCIRAARASLRMMSDSHGVAQFLEKWYLPLFYVSVSGMVVIIDLLRTNKRDMHSAETEKKINEVKGALDQMRGIADVSHPSRAAVKVMDFLMAEVEERRRPPGVSLGKRKAASPSPEGDDGLQRAVKKLIRQAQLEADSPRSHSVSGNTPTSSARHMSSSPVQGASTGGNKDPMPVFDAYPLPSAASGGEVPTVVIDPPSGAGTKASSTPAPGANGTTNGSAGAAANPYFALGSGAGSLGVPSTTYQALSPFTFPVDPTSTTNFPPPASIPLVTPQLDPAIESMLASYFPQSPNPPGQYSGNAQYAPSVNFGAGAGGAGGLGGAGAGGGGGGQPDDFLSRVFGFSWDATPAAGQLNAEMGTQVQPGNAQDGGMDMLGVQGGGFAPFEGWTSGGWMA